MVTPRVRRGRRPSVLTVVGSFLAAFVLIAAGSFMLRQLYSGASAQTTVVYCPAGKTPICDALWPPITKPVQITAVPITTTLSPGLLPPGEYGGVNLSVTYDGCTVTKVESSCPGVAPPPRDKERLVKLYQSGPEDVGKVIAVHAHEGPGGTTLTADSSGVAVGLLGLGCISLVIGIVEIVRRRRSDTRPPSSSLNASGTCSHRSRLIKSDLEDPRRCWRRSCARPSMSSSQPPLRRLMPWRSG
jgi:hypothetical protein